MTVDLADRSVVRGTERTTLTPTEAKLFGYLLKRRNELVSTAELLEHVWGLRPDTRTYTIYVTMNRLRRKVEADPRRPEHLLNQPGSGYLLRLDETSADLPRSDTTFWGRAEELLALEQAVHEGGIVVVVGPAGVGKTRLALRWLQQGTGPRWFVGLAEGRTAEDLGSAVAREVRPAGVDAMASPPPHGVWRDLGPGTVVIDGCEALEDEALTLLRGWSEEAPEVSFVLTSRRRLRIAGAAQLPLGPLGDEAAEQVFLARARAVDPQLQPDRGEVRALVRALDGLPLALELAARRVRVMSVPQIRQAVDRQLTLLRSSGSDLPARHRSLRAALQTSWDLLSDECRRALAALSVFASPFTLEAATSVVGEWLPDILEQLVEHSLLTVEKAVGGPRFAMLGSVRAFAVERCSDRDAVLGRHAIWFAELGTGEAIDELRGSSVLRQQRTAEVADLWAAAHASRGEPHLCANVLAVLTEVTLSVGPVAPLQSFLAELCDRQGVPWRLHWLRCRLLDALGQHELGAVVAERALAASSGSSPCELWVQLGRHRSRLGKAHEAEACYQQVLQASEDHRSLGMGNLGLGTCVAQSGALARAEAYYGEAADHFRAANLPHGEAMALVGLANVACVFGRWEQGRSQFERALHIFDEVGDDGSRSRALTSLAVCLIDEGRADEALSLYDEALAMMQRTGSRGLEGTVLADIGTCKLALGRVEEGRRELERALSIAQRMGNARLEILVQGNLGTAAWLQRNLPEALRRFEHALAGATEVGLSRARVTLAIAVARAYRGEDVDVWLEQADASESVVALPYAKAQTCVLRACVLRLQGDEAGADRLAARAMKIARDTRLENSVRFQALMRDFRQLHLR
ncbi:MAG: tetratricopeptide repeat protein [Myxococcales bacterium]|nr:tetratricopeptide repeat protein [Myxococcales bacterium]